MAAVLTPSQVAGSHVGVYEAYYRQVDPVGSGNVGALDAAKFLKKSGLADSILSKIWDLSDPSGRGFLDKYSFFVALKLVSVAQTGKDISATSLTLDVPPPNMGDPLPSLSNVDWTIKPTDKTKYDQLFDSLGPLNGKLPSSRVKPVMLNSKLPVDVLGRVWDLSDMDGDGHLDRDEFALAMHLIYKALENHPVPTVLPSELIPLSKQKKLLPGAVPVLPNILPGIDAARLVQVVTPPLVGAPPIPPLPSDVTSKNALNRPSVLWVVTAAEKAKYDIMFKNADLDGDGFVNGIEIKDIFLQSGLPQPILAHIWNLCDTKQLGRLNAEQFSLAMYLVQQKLQGVEPPATLPPEMVPPSFRPKPGLDGTITEIGGITSGSGYENPELELICREIEELTKEKRQLEQDVTQKEADIRIKNGEIKLLSGELSTLTATLKQLETQRGEAQKRLDELDIQKSSLGKSLDDLREQVEVETKQVSSLRTHLQEQEAAIKDQDLELAVKRKELNELKSEETTLEHQVQSSCSKMDVLNKTLQETLLQISQAKAKITHLQENHRQLNDAISQYDSAISSGDASSISDSTFKLQLTNIDLEYSRLENGGGSSVSSLEFGGSAFEDDPFKSKDPFAAVNGFSSDPFSEQDPFKEADPFKEVDPFKDTGAYKGVNSVFESSDPFTDSFANADPFKDSDPFGELSSLSGLAIKTDPFDPFGTSGTNLDKEVKTNGDLFGSDPFGPPPVAPRSESPTPALPPKKSKQPPPRPAPPRGAGNKPPRAAPPAPSPDPFADAVVPLASASHNNADPFAAAFGSDPFDPFGNSGRKEDPFGGGGGGDGGSSTDTFANFADFDSKFSSRDLSEDEQLAWAKQESVRLEKDRQFRAAQKEQADLELALALSKAEAEKLA